MPWHSVRQTRSRTRLAPRHETRGETQPHPGRPKPGIFPLPGPPPPSVVACAPGPGLTIAVSLRVAVRTPEAGVSHVGGPDQPVVVIPARRHWRNRCPHPHTSRPPPTKRHSSARDRPPGHGRGHRDGHGGASRADRHGHGHDPENESAHTSVATGGLAHELGSRFRRTGVPVWRKMPLTCEDVNCLGQHRADHGAPFR